jgi:cysteine desulfurase
MGRFVPCYNGLMMNRSTPIYLDHSATTPVAPEVLDVMLPFLADSAFCGNPSSVHSAGRKARAALDDARDRVAALIGADYSEITFTSGGTEADNLAITGVITAAPPMRCALAVSAIEHHAVLHAAEALRKQGFRVSLLPVSADGVVDLEAAASLIDGSTALVSVMHANNEIGTIQPIQALAELAHSRGALFHTDAVQSAGLIPLDVKQLGCDLLSLSAHKFYGPKGAGALYARNGLKITPQMVGGGQERERRAGTENVAALVGMGAAASLAASLLPETAGRLTGLMRGFISKILETVPGARLNGSLEQRLCSNANFSFDGIDGSTLLMNLDRLGICASSGAACSSGSIEPSHVLSALGISRAQASGGVRFTAGRHTTEDELNAAADACLDIVQRLRGRL